MPMIFFALFAAVLVGVYVGIRRRIAPLRVLGVLGMLGGIVTMTLFALSQENVLWIHGVLVGVVLGGGLSLMMIVLAAYFLSQEARAAHSVKRSL